MQNIRVTRYSRESGYLSLFPVTEDAVDIIESVASFGPPNEKGEYWVDGRLIAKLDRYWQGTIEPEDRSWIAYIRHDGVPIVYLDRDPETGAIGSLTPDPS
jgi:hypothetical protein